MPDEVDCGPSHIVSDDHVTPNIEIGKQSARGNDQVESARSARKQTRMFRDGHGLATAGIPTSIVFAPDRHASADFNWFHTSLTSEKQERVCQNVPGRYFCLHTTVMPVGRALASAERPSGPHLEQRIRTAS